MKLKLTYNVFFLATLLSGTFLSRAMEEGTKTETVDQATVPVAISADEKKALTLDEDGTVHIWNLETKELLQTIKPIKSDIQRASFNTTSDGRTILEVTKDDGTTRYYDAATSEEIDRS